MNIWTVANQKGGVGKTTSTIALGGLLAERKQKVLLIDLDPHASLTYYFGIDSETIEQSAYDILLAGADLSKSTLSAAIQPTAFAGIHVLPSTMALATLDRKLGSRSGMGLVLKRGLAMLEEEYDTVLIDVPPVLGVLMVNALAACQQVVVPVQTEALALKGLERMLSTLTLVQNSLKKHHQITVVPTMYDRRTRASLEAYKSLLAQHGSKVWTEMIPIDTKFRDASAAHTPPSLHAPQARGVLAYQQLLQHLLTLSHQRGGN